jgi:hypothetical protein
MNGLVKGTTRVWDGDRLLAPEEYEVDCLTGIVQFKSPPAGPVRVQTDVVKAEPTSRRYRHKAQWKWENRKKYNRY